MYQYTYESRLLSYFQKYYYYSVIHDFRDLPLVRLVLRARVSSSQVARQSEYSTSVGGERLRVFLQRARPHPRGVIRANGARVRGNITDGARRRLP